MTYKTLIPLVAAAALVTACGQGADETAYAPQGAEPGAAPPEPVPPPVTDPVAPVAPPQSEDPTEPQINPGPGGNPPPVLPGETAPSDPLPPR